MEKKRLSQRKINTLIGIIFFLVLFFLQLSARSIRQSVLNEQKAGEYKTMCEEYSRNLAEVSDFLTEEVRRFVITGEQSSLDAYWDELKNSKRRELAITALSGIDLPEYEMRLLNIAKGNSDLLVSTETRAMRLCADAYGIDSAKLAEEVGSYVLNVVEKDMSTDEKKQAALDLVFNEEYLTQKSFITGSVQDFQGVMQKRLNMETQQARRNTNLALKVQTVLISLTMILIAVIYFVSYRYMIRPILNYTRQLKKMGTQPDEDGLRPEGSQEMHLLADKFNRMYHQLIETGNAKSAFLANMSHEIRTPLNSIIGYKYLMEKTKLNEEQQRYVRIISDSSKNLLSLINNILDFSKLEKNKIQTEPLDFSLREMFDELNSSFSYQIRRKKLYFKVSVSREIPEYLVGDSGLLKQVLNNLLSNAVKFTERGGIALQVEKRGRTPDGKIMTAFHVIDTGCGIKQGKAEVIFHSFEQADSSIRRSYGGTGLGLAIGRKLAVLMGGSLNVKSVYGQGADFCLMVPLAEGKRTDKPKKNRQVRDRKEILRGKKVLLVDDNEINRTMESEILQKLNLKVTTASGGREAVRICRRERFDMILMDIRMPGIDGYDAAKEIREVTINYDTCIVALTADAEENAIRKAHDVGMNDYLLKPIDMEQMAVMMTVCFAGGESTRHTDTQQSQEKAVLDTGKALERMDDDQNLYIRLLESFVRQKIVLTEENGLMADTLHTLKSTARGIGADCLAGEMMHLETYLQSDQTDYEQYRELVCHLKEIYDMTCIKIEHYLKTQKETACTEEISWEELVEKTGSGFARGEYAAVRLFYQHRNKFADHFGQNEYEQLEASVMKYDLESAGRIMKNV